jgi:hypothetical protein
MAQTRRKRRTKHRGNAAGIVEQRGRTSRPPSPEARKQQRKEQARQQRQSRYAKPPSWQRAATRSLVTTALFVVFGLATTDVRYRGWVFRGPARLDVTWDRA